jgi:hypothetical protein
LVAEVTASCRKVAPSQLVVVWQEEHSVVVAKCTNPPVEITVHALPVFEWQLEQLTAPVWFIRVPGPHAPPILWQLAQVVLVMGAAKWALTPVLGMPARGVAWLAVS